MVKEDDLPPFKSLSYPQSVASLKDIICAYLKDCDNSRADFMETSASLQSLFYDVTALNVNQLK